MNVLFYRTHIGIYFSVNLPLDSDYR